MICWSGQREMTASVGKHSLPPIPDCHASQIYGVPRRRRRQDRDEQTPGTKCSAPVKRIRQNKGRSSSQATKRYELSQSSSFLHCWEQGCGCGCVCVWSPAISRTTHFIYRQATHQSIRGQARCARTGRLGHRVEMRNVFDWRFWQPLVWRSTPRPCR